MQKVFLTSIEIMEYMYQRYFAIVIAFCANMLYSLGAHVLMRRRARRVAAPLIPERIMETCMTRLREYTSLIVTADAFAHTIGLDSY